jgi:hypothetical protein
MLHMYYTVVNHTHIKICILDLSKVDISDDELSKSKEQLELVEFHRPKSIRVQSQLEVLSLLVFLSPTRIIRVEYI